MKNAELITALRNCIGMYPDGSCDKCPYDKHPRCSIDMMRDAADALEAAEKRISRLEEEHNKTVTAIFYEEQKWWENRCKELETERMELTTKCRRLEAQLPKEGEWITADNPPKNEGLYLVGLSVGWDNEYVVRLARYTKDLSEALFSSKLSGDGWYRWDGDNDCDVICHPKYWMELPKPPNCGAKMKGENDGK